MHGVITITKIRLSISVFFKQTCVWKNFHWCWWGLSEGSSALRLRSEDPIGASGNFHLLSILVTFLPECVLNSACRLIHKKIRFEMKIWGEFLGRRFLVREKFAHVDGEPSGGSSVRIPESKDPHRREQNFLQFSQNFSFFDSWHSSSLPICTRLAVSLIPQLTFLEIFRQTCLQSHIPQPLRRHMQSFWTKRHLLKISPFSHPDQVIFLPEGVVLGFWNVECASNSRKN